MKFVALKGPASDLERHTSSASQNKPLVTNEETEAHMGSFGQCFPVSESSDESWSPYLSWQYILLAMRYDPSGACPLSGLHFPLLSTEDQLCPGGSGQPFWKLTSSLSSEPYPTVDLYEWIHLKLQMRASAFISNTGGFRAHRLVPAWDELSKCTWFSCSRPGIWGICASVKSISVSWRVCQRGISRRDGVQAWSWVGKPCLYLTLLTPSPPRLYQRHPGQH